MPKIALTASQPNKVIYQMLYCELVHRFIFTTHWITLEYNSWPCLRLQHRSIVAFIASFHIKYCMMVWLLLLNKCIFHWHHLIGGFAMNGLLNTFTTAGQSKQRLSAVILSGILNLFFPWGQGEELWVYTACECGLIPLWCCEPAKKVPEDLT